MFQFDYQIEEKLADIDTVKNIGLILNELVTNCVKHGFPDKREKRIQVRFEKTNELSHRLLVADNGVGFDSSIIGTIPKMSGLYLVELLCGEIKGKFGIRQSAGTQVTIEFPLLTSDEVLSK